MPVNSFGSHQAPTPLQSREPLLGCLAESWPPRQWCDVTILIAVSGGADSTALLCGLAQLRQSGPGRLVIGHFNHGLRGHESDLDEEFVRQLGSQLDLEVVIGRGGHRHASPESQPTIDSVIEEQCRAQRYDFLIQAAGKVGARYLVTAHTADDQAETILHRIMRGTGLRGLGGIPRARAAGPAVSLIRPLLKVDRTQVLDYLAHLGQAYRSDATNALLHNTRNRIRHELLPQLAGEFNPQIKKALTSLGELAGEAQAVIDDLVESILSAAVLSRHEQAYEIDCRSLAKQPRYLVRECLVQLWRRQGWPEQAMSMSHWQTMTDLALLPEPDPTGTQVFPSAVHCTRLAHRLRLEARGDRANS